MPQSAPPNQHQVLLLTLMAKVAVAAILATMLVRFSWFRRILLTERRRGLHDYIAGTVVVSAPGD